MNNFFNYFYYLINFRVKLKCLFKCFLVNNGDWAQSP